MTSKTSRGAFAAGTAAAFASIAIQPVRADTYSWKFALDATADHPMNVRAVEAFAKIRKQTNGQLDIKSYPNNTLGNVTAMLTQVRSGAIEMHGGAGGVLDTVVPLASIENLAFAFPDRRTAFAALDGDLGNEIRARSLDAGLVTMDKIWENGFRNVTNSLRPVRTVADLDGMKLRVSPGRLRVDTFRALGVAVTPLPSAELYTALQTRVVDGQETPLVYVETQHYFEVQKYASLTRHMWSGWWTLVNQAKWNSLPPNLQQILRTNMNEAAVLERHDNELLEEAVRDKLSRQGMLFNDVNPATFKAKLIANGYYTRWKAAFGDKAWDAMEKYTGKLA
jgi:tripartite ATP-independent transporter DctP family solute receptor